MNQSANLNSDRIRIVILFGVVIAFAFSAFSIAKALSFSSTKYQVAVMAGIFFLVSLLLLRSQYWVEKVLVVAFAFALPMNLDINLFYREHVGGASGITVSASVLVIVAIFLTQSYQYLTRINGQLLQTNRALLVAPVLFIFCGVLSLVNAKYPVFVGFGLIQLLTFLFTLIVVMNIRQRSSLMLFVDALILNVLLQGVLALTQYATNETLGLELFGEEGLVNQNIGHTVSRATATVGHPNILGYFFEITIPITLALFLTTSSGIRRSWYFVVFCVATGGVLTTLSRGAWLTLPVSSSIVLFFLYRKKIFRMQTGLALIFLSAVFCVAAYFAYPTIEKRFTHTDYKSSSSRMPLNIASVSIIKQYPVIGVGLNNFSEVFKVYDSSRKSRIFKGYKHVVHNLYLFVWTEVGTLGFIAFLGIFFSTFLVIREAYQRAPPWENALLVGIFAGLIAHLMHGMIDPGFKISFNLSMVVYSLIGLVGAISLVSNRNSTKAGHPSRVSCES